MVLRKSDFRRILQQEKEQVMSLPIRELIGSLLYISQRGRCDILPSLAIVAQCCISPTLQCWNALKRMIKYLKNQLNKKWCRILLDYVYFIQSRVIICLL